MPLSEIQDGMAGRLRSSRSERSPTCQFPRHRPSSLNRLLRCSALARSQATTAARPMFRPTSVQLTKFEATTLRRPAARRGRVTVPAGARSGRSLFQLSLSKCKVRIRVDGVLGEATSDRMCKVPSRVQLVRGYGHGACMSTAVFAKDDR